MVYLEDFRNGVAIILFLLSSLLYLNIIKSLIILQIIQIPITMVGIDKYNPFKLGFILNGYLVNIADNADCINAINPYEKINVNIFNITRRLLNIFFKC